MYSNYNMSELDQSFRSANFYSLDLKKNERLLNTPFNTAAYQKGIEGVDYSCISFLTSNRKPDVYAGNEVINANSYKVVQEGRPYQQEKLNASHQDMSTSMDKSHPTRNTSDEGIESVDSSNDEEQVKYHQMRYYNAKDIRLKCENCDEFGHLAKSCPNEVVIICLKCNQKGHLGANCPNMKCFKCNKIGHRSFECKVRRHEVEKCDNCKNVGHFAADCLMKPCRITKSTMENIICEFCGKTGHLICPKPDNPYIIEVYDSDEVVLSDSEGEEEEKRKENRDHLVEFESDCEDDFYSILKKAIESKNRNLSNNKNSNGSNKKSTPSSSSTAQLTKKKHKRVLNSIRNQDIPSTIFCPKCAEMHSMRDCSIPVRNYSDYRRKVFNKTVFYGETKNKRKNYESDDSNEGSITEELKKHRRSRANSVSNNFASNNPELNFIHSYQVLTQQTKDNEPDEIGDPMEYIENLNRLNNKKAKRKKFKGDNSEYNYSYNSTVKWRGTDNKSFNNSSRYNNK